MERTKQATTNKLTPGQALMQRLLKKGVEKHKKDMAKMGVFFSKTLENIDLKELRRKAWKAE